MTAQKAIIVIFLLALSFNGGDAGWWVIDQKILMGLLTGGIVAGVDQAVDSGRTREIAVYNSPATMSSQNTDSAIYIIIVSGTLGGIGVILIFILILYICNIARTPAALPEAIEMRNV
ncbi:unnamed protein product [Orchesella dallaii]|uniref:Uncharacterized protein n=1 Tax=Orchesella dallaii TaxID=48710 RepID=A0ABP1QSD0_9HEXA